MQEEEQIVEAIKKEIELISEILKRISSEIDDTKKLIDEFTKERIKLEEERSNGRETNLSI
jgi:hypothetical protein